MDVLISRNPWMGVSNLHRILQNTSLCFALRAAFGAFQFVPDKLVSLFLRCITKRSNFEIGF